MIKVFTTDIFQPVEGGTSAIVLHGTNCQGIMGAGIAATIKKLYPEAYEAYKTKESTTGLHLGEISVSPRIKGRISIINMQTQNLSPVKGLNRCVCYNAVEKGIDYIRNLKLEKNRKWIIRFPMIGGGLGGGNWNIIAEIIDQGLPDSDFEKHLHVLPDEFDSFLKTISGSANRKYTIDE